MTAPLIKSTASRTSGYDAPVRKLEDDFLKRGPLAREVYSVAVNGPKEWSVRIGVYGEWGSGKTTVLEFVSSFAMQDENFVVWFNPWEYESKESLWRAFVLKLFSEVETKLGTTGVATGARRKGFLAELAKVAKPAAGMIFRGADNAVGAGLELLKDYFSFGSEDLKVLSEALGGKRVLVLIDDLDRSSSALVPEILFALKEIMDVPGFSFVCAFDPAVVGKVLRSHHRGFGDGLKFLDKIIDYPVWLPPATNDGLLKIALDERKRHCPFVPETELERTLPLLPQNPRTIRQFIRLLALFERQIERFYDHELRWAVILSAAAIRARFPKLASRIFADLQFLETIGMRNTYERRTSEGKKVDGDIEAHITKSTSATEVRLSDSESDALKECLRQICGQVNLWTGTGVEHISQLVHMVERPCAVTLKEFDEFLSRWKEEQKADGVSGWLRGHARKFHLREIDVATNLVEYAVERYLRELGTADRAFLKKKGNPHGKTADLLLRLLEVVVVESNSKEHELSSREWIPVQLIVERLSALGEAVSPTHKRLWPRTRRLLLNLIKQWDDRIDPLVRLFQPFGYSRLGHFEGKEQKLVIRDLTELLRKRIAKSTVDRFLEAGFIDSVRGRHASWGDVEGLLFRVDGPLWAGERKAVLRALLRAKGDPAVQENAYELLVWIGELLKGRRDSSHDHVSQFIKDPVILPAIWAAATAVPFAPRYVYQLRSLPEQLMAAGVNIVLPPWWESSMREITFPKDRGDGNSSD